MEVNMADDAAGEMMSRWDWITVYYHDMPRPGLHRERLSGPWIRYKLYTGSAPDNRGRLWAFNLKKGFQEKVPRARLREARKPINETDIDPQAQ